MSLDLASKLDTRIRIERKVVTHDTQYGTEQVNWTEFACVWAEVKDILPSKAERLADSIQIGRRPARIRIRYLAGLAADIRPPTASKARNCFARPMPIHRSGSSPRRSPLTSMTGQIL